MQALQVRGTTAPDDGLARPWQRRPRSGVRAVAQRTARAVSRGRCRPEPPPTTPVGYSEQIQADVMTLSDHLDGRRFDTVLCGELIEHLEQPYDFLRGLVDVVVPGGRLVLSTPNPLGFPVGPVRIRPLAPAAFTRADHRFYFTPRWVDRMLDDTGGSGAGDSRRGTVAAARAGSAVSDHPELPGDLRRRPRVSL